MKLYFKIILVVFSISFAYIFLALSVDNKVYPEDEFEIKKLGLNDSCKNVITLLDEIECIKTIQNKIFKVAKNDQCHKGLSSEPKDLILRGVGCCVEFSRFIEKTLNYYNFETRHVFLIEPYKGFSILNFLPLGQQSHAGTEVLTSKGWMSVDSKHQFILAKVINDEIYVYSYLDLKNKKEAIKIVEGIGLYKKNLDIIYGLYSRHGYFYGLNLPGPEINLKEFIFNLIDYKKFI